MTAITHSPAVASTGPRPMNRIIAVARLNLANRWSMFAMPSLILGAILLLNMAIWYLALASAPAGDRARVSEGLGNSGSALFLFIYMMVIAVQAVSRTFPFALGYGVTRRNFYLGTALALVVQTAIFSIGLTILSAIEDATNGWGAGGHMFNPVYFSSTGFVQRFLLYYFLFLVFVFIGLGLASVYVRWRVTGMFVFFGVLAVALVGTGALITFNHQWPAIGTWLDATGEFGLICWSLAPAAIAAIAGFFILRRATPKN